VKQTDMKLHITMIHYYRRASGHSLGQQIRYQTLIYGQIIPRSDKERADFVIAIERGSKSPKFTVGKQLFGELISGQTRAAILREVKIRIAENQKNLNAGRKVGGKEEFTIAFTPKAKIQKSPRGAKK